MPPLISMTSNVLPKAAAYTGQLPFSEFFLENLVGAASPTLADGKLIINSLGQIASKDMSLPEDFFIEQSLVLGTQISSTDGQYEPLGCQGASGFGMLFQNNKLTMYKNATTRIDLACSPPVGATVRYVYWKSGPKHQLVLLEGASGMAAVNDGASYLTTKLFVGGKYGATANPYRTQAGTYSPVTVLRDLVGQMAGYSNSKATVSASSEYFSGSAHEAWRVFDCSDQLLDNSWYSLPDKGSPWLQVIFNEPQVVRKYSVQSIAGFAPSYGAIDWTLQYEDGGAWIDADVATAQNQVLPSVRTVQNPPATPKSKWRLLITKGKAVANGANSVIGELKLWGI